MSKKQKTTYYTPTKKNGHVSTRIHKAKTLKKCILCDGEIIPKTLYVKKIGVFNGEFYSSHFHYSCNTFHSNSIMGLCNPYKPMGAK